MTTSLEIFQFRPQKILCIPHSLVVGIGSDFLDEIIEQKLGFEVSDLLPKFLRNLSFDGWDDFLHLPLFQFHLRFPFKVRLE